MENTKTNIAWSLAEKCKCYKDTVFSLENGRADNSTLRAFLVDIYNLDCNSKWFYNNLETICNKHKIR